MWKSPEEPPEERCCYILILLKDGTVRYRYYGIKGWWIYSKNGFIIELDRKIKGWKHII